MTTTSRTRRRCNTLGLALFAWGFLQWRVDAGSPIDRKVEATDLDFATEQANEVSPLLHIPAEAAGTQRASDIYSVIVLSDRPQRSNAFRDRTRIHAYSGEKAVVVQFGDSEPADPLAPDAPPFYVSHSPRASKRVRIFHAVATRLPKASALSHLKAACEDPSELTLIVMTDEYCTEGPLTQTLPPACWSNIARTYPSNPERVSPLHLVVRQYYLLKESEILRNVTIPTTKRILTRRVSSAFNTELLPNMETRQPYLPLGPRHNFNFIHASERVPASKRDTFFGVAVSEGTAPRRVKLVSMTSEFKTQHPSITAFVNDKHLTYDRYQALLLDSAFTICPGGHNPETFRLFEALEAGSIPIVSRQDFLYPSYKAPFPCGEGDASWNTVAASPFAQAVSVGSWDELPGLLERLMSAPAEYIDQLQAESVAWYEALMRRMYRSFLHFGQGYDLWPQYGPIALEGFPAPTEPYPETPPYGPDEL